MARLTQYRDELKKEGLLTIPETEMIEQHRWQTLSIYIVGYILLWAVIAGVGGDPGARPIHLRPGYAALGIRASVLFVCGVAYTWLKNKAYLFRASPKERENGGSWRKRSSQ